MYAGRSASVLVTVAAWALQGLLFAEPAAGQGQGGAVSIPMQLQATPTATGSVVAWQRMAGATKYAVHRWKKLGNGTRCCDRHVFSLTVPRFVDEPLPGSGRYLYRVVAYLPNGVRGFEERTITAPAAAAPPVASAPPAKQATQPPPAPDPTAATLVSPDLPADVLRRMPPPASTTAAGPGASAPAAMSTPPSPASSAPAPAPDPAPSAAPTAAPAGQRAYVPGRLHRPLAPVAPAVSSEPAAAQSGRYLVTVTGLRAGAVTTDDMLHGDGKGDEVFAAAFVRRYDRQTANTLEAINRQTTVYGDVGGGRVSERAQAGRLSPLGGIADGDPIPADAVVARTVPAQERVFPWRLWEGTLTDGADALVITPSVWEYDGKPALFQGWGAKQSALTGTLFLSQRLQDHVSRRAFEPLVLDPIEVADGQLANRVGQLAGNTLISMALGIPPGLNFLGGEDRPIGIHASSAGPILPTTTVVLTREIIEAALAAPARGMVNPMPSVLIPIHKPGIMVINFEDKGGNLTDRRAFYYMVLQVERMP